MSKTKSQNDHNITLAERAILVSCITAIGLAFGLFGLFWTFSWMFSIILVIDVIVLVRGGALKNTVKRTVVTVSAIATLLAISFIVVSFTRYS